LRERDLTLYFSREIQRDPERDNCTSVEREREGEGKNPYTSLGVVQEIAVRIFGRN
jgi:hypothetical protein